MPFHIPPHTASISVRIRASLAPVPGGQPRLPVAGTVFGVATLAARPGYRVGVDVGGTFTDLVLVRDGAPSARRWFA
jgi:hypothetical protein